MKPLRLFTFFLVIVLASQTRAMAACFPAPGDPTVTICDRREDFYRAVADAGIVVGIESFTDPSHFTEVAYGFNSLSVNLGTNAGAGFPTSIAGGYFRAETWGSLSMEILLNLPNSRALGFDLDYEGSESELLVGPFSGSIIVNRGFVGIISQTVFNQFWISKHPFELRGAHTHALRVDNLEFDSTLPNIPTLASSPRNPRPPAACPDTVDPLAICAVTSPGPDWYDPAPTSGYYFSALGAKFLSIDDFPPGFGSAFEVSAGGTHLGQFAPGQRVEFRGGVTEFSISGITPSVEGSNPFAFPIKLSFDTIGAKFAMVPLGEEDADTTPPQVSCQGADGLWHGTDVTVTCTASDLSGLANAGDAAFTLSTAVAAGAEVDNAATGQRSVCDTAGNCADAGPIGGHLVDKKAPAIAISTPNAVTYTAGEPVIAAYACTDGGSGIDTCAGTVNSVGAIDTGSTGAKTFLVTARDYAGNTAQTSVNYTVVGPKRISGSGYNAPEVAAYRATFALDVTGAATPFGSVQYAYSRTRMNFVNTSIASFVVNGSVATIQGAGTVNGVPGFMFVATATDGAPDTFGIVIRRADGTIYYSAASLPLAAGALTTQQQ